MVLEARSARAGCGPGQEASEASKDFFFLIYLFMKEKEREAET